MLPRRLSARSKILLLCDLTKLADMIEMILGADRHFQTILIDQPAPWPIRTDLWDLILIGFSRPTGDPLSVLGRAGLTQWVGRRPKFIIMPSLFVSQPDELTWYLAFHCEP